MRNRSIYIVLTFLLLLPGCASLPKEYDRNPSTALTHPETTTLGKLFARSMDEHRGESGFLLINTGREALISRIALADIADKTIDCQYYIWKGDEGGRIFTDRLLRAADRGVRVRILIDDTTTGGKDFSIAAMDSHPHIEVRLFNPFGRGKLWKHMRAFQFIGNLSRLWHRMHNKLFAVDNQAAIVGGRNIGNEYFGIDPKYNFRDLEVLAAGPVVADLSKGFDTYWNSEWAIPISAFDIAWPAPEEASALQEKMKLYVAGLRDFPYETEFLREDVLRKLKELQNSFIWGEGSVIYDTPDKVGGEVSQHVDQKLREVGKTVKRDILVVSPYLSVGSDSLDNIEAAAKEGIRQRLLTNSLATNDVVVAHSVYAKYRRQMLARGIEIYETRPDPASRNTHSAVNPEGTRIGLHAKGVVFDGETVYIGSYNLNRVGRELSTETGLIIYSPEFANEVTAALEVDMRPENSWRLVLDENRGTPEETFEGYRGLTWVGEERGKEVRQRFEPGAGFWLNLQNGFFYIFPLADRI